MNVDVYAVDMTGMGCEAAVVSRPGSPRVILMLDHTVSLHRADQLMAEYLSSQEQVAAVIHCSCEVPSPLTTRAHGDEHLGGWHMAAS